MIARDIPNKSPETPNATYPNTHAGYAFCTVFDRKYASRALAMAKSLFQHAPNSKLYSICADNESFEAFKSIRDDRLIPISLADCLGETLNQLRRTRSHTELMWTLSSYSFDIVFDSFPRTDLVTYVDADIFFLKSPIPIIEKFERSESGAMITQHAYSTRLSRLEAKFGVFNVQFIPMKRNEGAQIRERWKDQCTEWCFARHENGQFGDQKYLNEWPDLWGGRVLVWPRPDRFQGPWNAEDFEVREAVTYHFSTLKASGRNKIQIAREEYVIPRKYRSRAYFPYLRALRKAETELRKTSLFNDTMAPFTVVIPLGRNNYWHM